MVEKGHMRESRPARANLATFFCVGVPVSLFSKFPSPPCHLPDPFTLAQCFHQAGAVSAAMLYSKGDLHQMRLYGVRSDHESVLILVEVVFSLKPGRNDQQRPP